MLTIFLLLLQILRCQLLKFVQVDVLVWVKEQSSPATLKAQTSPKYNGSKTKRSYLNTQTIIILHWHQLQRQMQENINALCQVNYKLRRLQQLRY